MQDTKQALLEATKGKKTYSLYWLTHATRNQQPHNLIIMLLSEIRLSPCVQSPWFIPEIKEKAKCRRLEIRWWETRLTADREIYMQRCAVIQGIICMFLKFVLFLYILVLSSKRNFVTLLHTIFESWQTCCFSCAERVFSRFI